jgi:subtilisin family serine protease
MNTRLRLAPTILAALTGFACVALTLSASAAPTIAEGRILVKPAAGLSDDKLARLLRRVGGRAKERISGIGVRIVEVPPQAERAVAAALARNPNIAFAEPDVLVEQTAIPNDPSFGEQWHLAKMQAPTAWDTSDGSGVIVAVCDSGVFASHPDLNGQVLPGWNTASGNTDSSDINGHGTKVAGTIAASTNNLLGVASTAPGAKILPIRVTNDTSGSAYYSNIAKCIQWAADNGARVANASYLAAGSSTVASAGSYMMSKGGVAMVSAGNYNTDHGYSNSPYLYVVAATTSTDARASYSSYGGYVDISAPGSSIKTTTSSGSYASASGTSFSSPNTAAVAALVMAANPSLTATDVLAVISSTSTDLGTSGWDVYFGHGRVNALAAVELAASADTSDTTAPDVVVASPTGGSTVSGDVSIKVQASDNFGVESVDLYVDGRVVATEIQATSSGYLFTWDSTGVDDGEHRIGARAVDAAGNIGAASDVVVTVSNIDDSIPPEAIITSPGDGANISRSVTLSGYGNDDQGVTQFSLSVNGQLKCSGTTSASCGWNTRKLAAGSYTISARAVDRAGNIGESAVTVTVGGGDSADGGDSGSSKPGQGKGRKK